jgi:hypothetical protein
VERHQAGAVSARNGACPASISKAITPSAYTSDRRSHGATLPLLRRHVDRAADVEAGSRDGGATLGQARDAEVGEPGVPALVEEHVPRFHVAVDDALVVRMLEPGGDVSHQAGHGDRGNVPLAQRVRHGAAAQELHDEVQPAFRLPALQYLHDVGMPQALYETAFPFEPPPEVGVGEQFATHELDRRLASVDDVTTRNTEAIPPSPSESSSSQEPTRPPTSGPVAAGGAVGTLVAAAVFAPLATTLVSTRVRRATSLASLTVSSRVIRPGRPATLGALAGAASAWRSRQAA